MITSDAPWLSIAYGELGQREIAGEADNPRIVEYHKATTLKATDDETPWCSSFACWCLEQAGYRHPKSARSRDFIDHESMERLDKPRVGCVVVLTRKGGGHVGFLAEDKPNVAMLIGGNQGNAVSIRDYPVNRVLGYFWPKPKAIKASAKEVVQHGLPIDNDARG